MVSGKFGLVAGAVLAILAAQAGFADVPAPSGAAQTSGIETQYEDPTVRPQDDIYKYLNGKWLANTQIPADKPGFGTFDKLYDESQDQLKAIVDAAAKNAN